MSLWVWLLTALAIWCVVSVVVAAAFARVAQLRRRFIVDGRLVRPNASARARRVGRSALDLRGATAKSHSRD